MGFPLFELFRGGDVRSGAGWTEIRVQAPATPGRLDQQDRFTKLLFQVNPESEFRPDLVIRSAKSRGQFTLFLS